MRSRPVTSVGRRLGLDRQEAATLLGAMRARVGARQFAVRLAAFHVAAGPGGRLLPIRVRRRALAGLVGPLLEPPAALNAYAGTRPWRPGDPCAGLVPEA